MLLKTVMPPRNYEIKPFYIKNIVRIAMWSLGIVLTLRINNDIIIAAPAF